MPRTRPPARNLLEMVPCRAAEDRVEPSGLVTVLRPKFVSGPFARWVQPRLRKPHYNVHLDELGTRVWGLIDGERTVEEIAEALREQVGDLEQDVDRLAAFLTELEGGGMIRYRDGEPAPDA